MSTIHLNDHKFWRKKLNQEIQADGFLLKNRSLSSSKIWANYIIRKFLSEITY